MSPRPYQLGRRQDQIDESRRRVLDAAKALLAETTSYTAFTIDAVAKRADVARATVYYQFGSKTGLLEALCDSLAEAGHMAELGDAFADPDPVDGINAFIRTFGRFWAADRLVMRRLRALAALDPEVHQVIAARDELRREGLRTLVGRLAELPKDAVRVLHTLTSFETFDALAGEDCEVMSAVPLVTELVQPMIRPTRRK